MALYHPENVPQFSLAELERPVLRLTAPLQPGAPSLESTISNTNQQLPDVLPQPEADEQTPPILTLVKPHSNAQKLSRWSRKHEKEAEPKFTLRFATQVDIDAIVDVDMKSFDSVYSAYDQTEDELRAQLKEKFSRRLDLVGSEWMPVLERDGDIVGFMTCCPTNKTPQDFNSWEDTTDGGTLESTFDPNGKNVYVVTLSVLPEGSAGKDMLYANQIGKMMREGYDLGFFESRLPGLKQWMDTVKAPELDKPAAELTAEETEACANEYFNLRTTSKKGKEIREDRLIRLYERIGCVCLKVVPDAYQDEPSMNFGVVCIYDGKSLFDGSDLPIKLPENRATRWAFGVLMQRVARSSKITEKLFS